MEKMMEKLEVAFEKSYGEEVEEAMRILGKND